MLKASSKRSPDTAAARATRSASDALPCAVKLDAAQKRPGSSLPIALARRRTHETQPDDRCAGAADVHLRYSRPKRTSQMRCDDIATSLTCEPSASRYASASVAILCSSARYPRKSAQSDRARGEHGISRFAHRWLPGSNGGHSHVVLFRFHRARCCQHSASPLGSAPSSQGRQHGLSNGCMCNKWRPLKSSSTSEGRGSDCARSSPSILDRAVLRLTDERTSLVGAVYTHVVSHLARHAGTAELASPLARLTGAQWYRAIARVRLEPEKSAAACAPIFTCEQHAETELSRQAGRVGAVVNRTLLLCRLSSCQHSAPRRAKRL